MSIRPRVLPRGSAKPRISHRQHIDYEYAARALNDGYDLFFTGLRRQTIHTAAKKLSRMLGQDVYAFSMDNGNERGYGVVMKSSLEQKKAQIRA